MRSLLPPGMIRRTGGAVARRLLGTLTHVITDQPVAALTFDDGPHPQYTSEIADILEAHEARATFFMVGEAARAYPDVLRRIARGGHAIGNHSWDHPAFPLITGRERRRQIRVCQETLSPFGMRLFRPPYGGQSLRARLDAMWLGYQVVAWSLSVSDWMEHRPEVIAAALQEALRPGSIILLHDGLYHPVAPQYSSREPTVEAVRRLLGRMSGRYRFVTVPELVQCGRPYLENWYWKVNPAWLNSLLGQKRRYSLHRTGTRHI